ncbi:MAG: trypsin-like peptidase domain-containing protein [Anaerolineaceae bacterium]|nr:trypsin-like peptidase domain-containing protein [Anaerolineaceae bacterium]
MKKNKSLILFLLTFLLFIGVACSCSLFGPKGTAFEWSDRVTQEAQVVESTEEIAVEEQSDETQPTATAPIEMPDEADTSDLLNIDALDERVARIYEAVNPGVVSIRIWSDMGNGVGTGFVYDKEGHIITNYHVVQDAEKLEVDFPSGLKVWSEVVATDPDSDLAVLKVDVDPDYLIPLKLGSSTELQIGDMVIAIGNPYGLSSTITMGIVSAKGRTMESLRTSNTGGYFSAGDIIQTDATINPGNSGGPLLNMAGEVVGVNRAIQTSGFSTTGDPVNTGIGFAISIDIVKRVVPVLIEDGEFNYPYIGISALEELSLLEQELYGIDYPTGAYITTVVSNSPASEAGLVAASVETVTYEGQEVEALTGGDLIIGVDGTPIRIFGELLSYIMLEKSPGDVINLTILRDGEQMEIPLTLGFRPAN